MSERHVGSGCLRTGNAGAKCRQAECVTRFAFQARKILPALGCLLLVCALFERAAWACSCVIRGEQEMVGRADIAAEATVIADAPFDIGIGNERPHRSSQRGVTVFRVERVLKGSLPGTRIAVLHSFHPPICGLRFAPDTRYLLTFVRERDGMPKPLVASVCAVKPLGPRDR